ncbi:MAG: hypothetical protein CM15mP101_06060 [Flavobacteriaceae bacterium]|nr:MAG: hypothetical protein CM15mP101_06060 [Flavobacteriaceae bacterium]
MIKGPPVAGCGGNRLIDVWFDFSGLGVKQKGGLNEIDFFTKLLVDIVEKLSV